MTVFCPLEAPAAAGAKSLVPASYVQGPLGAFAVLTNLNEFHVWCLPVCGVEPEVFRHDSGTQVGVVYTFKNITFTNNHKHLVRYANAYREAGLYDLQFKPFEFSLPVPQGLQLIGDPQPLENDEAYVGASWKTNRSAGAATGRFVLKSERKEEPRGELVKERATHIDKPTRAVWRRPTPTKDRTLQPRASGASHTQWLVPEVY